MELLKLRPTYQRAGTDDVEQPSRQDSDHELPEYRSMRSFTSARSEAQPQRYGSDYELLGDNNIRSVNRHKSKWVIRFEGWRTGASTAAVCALVSMCINLAVALWLASMGKNTAIVEVYHGNCDTVTRADLWVHLAINVMSTLLLGGSNFCSTIPAPLYVNATY
jgi:hypothetical protein